MDDRPADENSSISESVRRQQFLETANAAYAALRQDPERWQEELEERAIWEATPADGLDLPKSGGSSEDR